MTDITKDWLDEIIENMSFAGSAREQQVFEFGAFALRDAILEKNASLEVIPCPYGEDAEGAHDIFRHSPNDWRCCPYCGTSLKETTP